MLRDRPSGDLFGWTQNAGMGWTASALGGAEFLMLSTHGGIRAPDGTPIALGYHTGHWEVGLLMEAAAREISQAGAIPFAASCTDPCDGRSQGTPAMFDSLPFRNDAAVGVPAADPVAARRGAACSALRPATRACPP